MDDDLDELLEIAEIARGIQNTDIILELAKEIHHARCLERLVINLTDQLAILELKMRRLEMYRGTT